MILSKSTGWKWTRATKEDVAESTSHLNVVKNKPLSRKGKKAVRHIFQKEAFKKAETTKDVDAALAEFQRRYPHLKPPGPLRGDPFPSVNLTDMRGLHDEHH